MRYRTFLLWNADRRPDLGARLRPARVRLRVRPGRRRRDADLGAARDPRDRHRGRRPSCTSASTRSRRSRARRSPRRTPPPRRDARGPVVHSARALSCRVRPRQLRSDHERTADPNRPEPPDPNDPNQPPGQYPPPGPYPPAGQYPPPGQYPPGHPQQGVPAQGYPQPGYPQPGYPSAPYPPGRAAGPGLRLSPAAARRPRARPARDRTCWPPSPTAPHAGRNRGWASRSPAPASG